MIVKFIVDRAIYKSLQDPEHQPVINSGYAAFVLSELNLLLNEWRDYIPFKETITFNNIENLTNTTFSSVRTVNYIIDTVSFALKRVTLTQLKEIETIIRLKSFPEIYYFDELKQTIQIYPAPSDQAFTITVWGRVLNVDLGLTDAIPANLPPFMVNALIYELAFRAAGQYGIVWDDKKEITHQSLVATLINKKDIDLTPARNLIFGIPKSRDGHPWPTFYFLSGGGG